MGSTSFAAWPVATYGVVMLLAGFAYYILTRVLIAAEGRDSPLAKAVGRDLKGKLSLAFYALAIPLSFVDPRLAGGLYVVVAIIWLIPDPRIEATLTERKS